MSTSARLSALAAVKPPKPEPMMTTLCLSVAVAPGWLILGSSTDYTCTYSDTTVAAMDPSSAVRYATSPRELGADERFQCFAQCCDVSRPVAVALRGQVDDYPVDSGPEDLGLDLVGDLLGAAD